MAKEKSIVEDAILQMKNLEEAVAQNAKGILASTMKEEISELVKESLSEQEEEDETEADVEVDDTDIEDSDETSDEEEEEVSDDEVMSMDDMGTDISMDSMDNDSPIDLSNEKVDDIIRVFELMGPNDKIIVKKDNAGNINLKDNESNKEYMIVGESEEEEFDEEEMYEEEMDEEMDEEMYEEDSIESIVDKVFGPEDSEEEEEFDEFEESEEEESVMYEIEMEDDGEEEEFDEELDEEEDVVYEIEMEDDEEEEEDSEFIGESKITKKPKGVGMGKPKFSYKGKPNMEGGFKTVKKKSDKAMGTGSAKKVNIYKAKTNMDGKNKVVKKMETKEASRTLGAGRNFGRKGLPKPKASPRHIRLESTDAEMQILRQKNDEYRKALNVFRNKLNEVAVFNSNLAYATRLFTEHSTSKQEKINILRRFDTVETLKESKNLYKQIKDELGTSKTEQLTESVERVIQKSPSTGSSTTLIESKTYENPQFLRMKDLMSKLK